MFLVMGRLYLGDFPLYVAFPRSEYFSPADYQRGVSAPSLLHLSANTLDRDLVGDPAVVTHKFDSVLHLQTPDALLHLRL